MLKRLTFLKFKKSDLAQWMISTKKQLLWKKYYFQHVRPVFIRKKTSGIFTNFVARKLRLRRAEKSKIKM